MRCPEPCGKVIYTAEITAQLACVRAALEGDASLTWYYSKDCKCWHQTSTAKKGKTGSRVKWVEGFKGGADGCAAA